MSRWCFVSFFKAFLFICSILSGALFAIVWHRYQLAVLKFGQIHLPLNPNVVDGGQMLLDQRLNRQNSPSYDDWLRQQSLQSVLVPREQLSYGSKQWKQSFKSEAQFLKEMLNVHCMIFSGSKSRAKALRDTWTQHCNSATFYGTFKDRKIPTVHVRMVKHSDDSIFSVRSFCQAFVHMVDDRSSPIQLKPKFDWIFIAMDKTYAIIENLRHLVAPLNQSEPYYLGRPVRHYFLGIYNSYDSGIVLSRGAVKLLIDGGLFEVCRAMIDVTTTTNSTINTGNNRATQSAATGNFDSFLALELSKFNVRPSNTLDGDGLAGLSRFHPFMPEKHILPELISTFDSFWSTNVLRIKTGYNCCSDKAITFTGFAPVTMYFIEYIIYHLTAFPQSEHWNGLGNKLSSYEAYRVSSDLDQNPNKLNGNNVNQSHSPNDRNSKSIKFKKKKRKIKSKQQIQIEQMFLDAVINIRN